MSISADLLRKDAGKTKQGREGEITVEYGLVSKQKSYSISYNPFWMYKGWSSQMLASLYNSLFVLAVLEIIDISLASGKWALLNSQIQKYVWICFLGELSTIVFYNSKEPGGGKWFLPRSIISDLAWTRLDRREGGKFLSRCLEHLSDAK